MSHETPEELLQRMAKESCGDCISTPCPHCAYLVKFGRKVLKAASPPAADTGQQKEHDHTRMDRGDSTDSRTAPENEPAPTGGGFAMWTFDREDDGRHIAVAHVVCYGVDDTDAMAECVKHLLVDALVTASPPAADTGRLIEELLRRRGAAILDAVKAKDRDLGYQVGMLLEDISRIRARVSGQPVGVPEFTTCHVCGKPDPTDDCCDEPPPAADTGRLIEEAERLLKYITPGEWSYEDDSFGDIRKATLYAGRGSMLHGMNLLGRLEPDWNGRNNLEFIAAAPRLVHELLAALKALPRVSGQPIGEGHPPASKD